MSAEPGRKDPYTLRTYDGELCGKGLAWIYPTVKFLRIFACLWVLLTTTSNVLN